MISSLGFNRVERNVLSISGHPQGENRARPEQIMVVGTDLQRGSQRRVYVAVDAGCASSHVSLTAV